MGQTLKLFGIEIDRYIDCPDCKTKGACEFDKYTYRTPCDDCKQKPEYLAKEKEKNGWGDKGSGYGRNTVTGVFTGHGRNFFVNRNGDIVKDEPYKPLEAGK